MWPLAQLREVVEVAKANGLRLHMDGARLMNAVVASGIPTTEWTQGFDTAWIDFSKGLGAPMGAVLAGSRELIDEAWRYKQMMGGALRQAGIVAAGALWALDHHVERLAMDHDNARTLARGLAEHARASRSTPPRSRPTSSSSASATPAALCTQLAVNGVIMGALDERTVRAVTHLDVGAEDIATRARRASAARSPPRRAGCRARPGRSRACASSPAWTRSSWASSPQHLRTRGRARRL